MGEFIFLGARYQITWQPSLFPVDSLDELLIPISPLL
jgi:hypothetical protein